ncbi:MAG: DUF938 domain-containing protein [Gammaproteobacteria bacterium]
MNLQRPYAESCEQNQQVILQILQQVFTNPGRVLEIGSGTGQHVLFFSNHMPHLSWQPTDIVSQLEAIRMWMEDADHDRIQSPRELDLRNTHWLIDQGYDYVFTANTTHIVSWPLVQAMFKGVAESLKSGGRFAQYGPFNYAGQYTSDSNARFDSWLKDRDPDSGIRNFEDLQVLAHSHGLELQQDYAMPANNRILVWRKV